MSHPIQERIENADLNSLSDADLVILLLESWEAVCEENARELDLVSESDAKRWVQFRDSTNKSIQSILAEFYEYNENLSDKKREQTLSYLNKISGAKQETMERTPEPSLPAKPKETLEQRQERYEDIEKRHGFFARLKKIIGK